MVGGDGIDDELHLYTARPTPDPMALGCGACTLILYGRSHRQVLFGPLRSHRGDYLHDDYLYDDYLCDDYLQAALRRAAPRRAVGSGEE